MAAEAANTATKADSMGGFLGGLLTPGGIIGGGMGILGLLGGLFDQGPSRERIEEEYNRAANAKLNTNYEAINALSPQANATAAMQGVTRSQNAAVGQALNATMGNMASSGDFTNGMGRAAGGMQAAQAAAAPFAQQAAGIQQNAMSQQLQKQNQITDVANSQASLSNHVSYLTQQSKNPIMQALRGLQGGANAGANIFALLNNAYGRSNMQRPTTQSPYPDPETGA